MLKTSGHVKKYCKPVLSIFKGCSKGATLEEYMKAIEKYALQISDEDERRTFKGDMLEILAEIFFKAFENSPTVGLRNYTPIPLDQDYGVDAKGINANGETCAVQVKYRLNPLEEITYSDIARTYASGNIQLKLDLKGKDRIYVFTTASGVNKECRKVFNRMVRVIGKNIIRREINNNVNFWLTAFNEIVETLNSNPK